MLDSTESARRERWNERYRLMADEAQSPAELLTENLHLLPAQGRALELACGLGANALFLARAGLDVLAVDYALPAVERLHARARAEGLSVIAECADLTAWTPEEAAFDLIVVAHYLHRPLAPLIERALAPGGRLFYQTFTNEREQGPSNPLHLLVPGELAQLFPGLQTVLYREEGPLAAPGNRRRGLAQLIARRP
ncbi:MAG: methyltransferase domain-containing protein [Halothiobacillaceae bacterium]|nr:methyltransferase domain-containing protein [Halothiobacillaceae bacterium]